MRRLRPPFAVAGLAAALSSCGAHGTQFEDDVLRKGDLRVAVGPVPADWRRIQVDGADLAFRDDARGGSALFDVRCGGKDDDAPLSALTGHLIMGTTERVFERQEVVPFDRREAMHTLLQAKLDGVAMRYDIYVMKKDGCVYDLVYVAAPERFEEGAKDFERFALGLRTGASPSAAAADTAGASRDP
jgi:hypothetical protein